MAWVQLMAFSIDFSKEVTDTVNKVLVAFGIVIGIAILLSIVGIVVTVVKRSIDLSNSIKTSKILRAERRANKAKKRK